MKAIFEKKKIGMLKKRGAAPPPIAWGFILDEYSHTYFYIIEKTFP
jgi:hypothetical protein